MQQENLNKKHIIDYENIEPIKKTIEPEKRADRYYMHMYFTRRPFNVIQKYIENFSNPNDIVLDPYVGTGVTAVESLIMRRKTIAMDLAPLSTFLAKMIAISPININKLIKSFNEIKEKLKPEIKDIYKLDNSYIEGKFEKIIKEHDLWYPKNIALPSRGSAQVTKGYKNVDELFTKKQLISLAMLLKEINSLQNKIERDLFRFTFSSTLHYTNKMFRPEKTASSPTGVYRYWVPKNISEVDVWDYFERRFKYVIKGKNETNKLIGDFYKENDTFKTYTASATNIKKFIDENSIDYIFTDPPYGANIAYLDLTTMWDAWLGFKVSQEEKELEVIEGGQLGKTQQNYIDLLSKSFDEMFDVLKKGRWMSIVFHHKELILWNAVVNGAKNAGFKYINVVTQPSIKMPTFRKIQSPLRALAGELIINFQKTRKPLSGRIIIASNINGIILNIAERLIIQNNGATIDEIYHAIIPELLDANLIDLAVKEINDITPILKKEFELDNKNKWQIKSGAKIGSWIPRKDKIKFYLTSMLRREGEMDVDKIISSIMPLLINGVSIDNKEIMDVLKEIAEPTDGKWKLKKEAKEELEKAKQEIETII